ncbi:type II restriction endonuclease [Mycoplasma zalophidermidis]|uniref:Type-2 restriction enzyme n=1 Tax=Mycoplasma zalophidermidis TaxID=398174 RepID=A0ABS6DRL7_9MOLU|nr:type II restriction endonuclease [Mycoplasma zalophidermidis]MBU4693657.1 type II restriction endonuclease [Mycoplasma zalophidermidis]
MKLKFEDWLKTFKSVLFTYDYFVDFPKVRSNANKINNELSIMNSLISSKNIEEDFRKIILNNPKLVEFLPILLAKRIKHNECIEVANGRKIYFNKFESENLQNYVDLMNKTGFFKILERKEITNIKDYVFGLEVGLDSNARKNRVGKLMEELVENSLINFGYAINDNLFKQTTLSNLGVEINNKNIQNKKKFDFIVFDNGIYYGIECNFYSSGGSKLNETARSYKNIAIETANEEKFKFVWITDGVGWKTAKNALKETYEPTDSVFNIEDIKQKLLIAYFKNKQLLKK